MYSAGKKVIVKHYSTMTNNYYILGFKTISLKLSLIQRNVKVNVNNFNTNYNQFFELSQYVLSILCIDNNKTCGDILN